MSNLFNTPFETGLRVMLLLSVVSPKSMTIDRITAYDFMTIYGKDFDVSEKNLHGDNSLSFSELSSKREICADGIKMLVLDGLIAINRTQAGFLYMLTSAGRKYVSTLNSDYKLQYLQIAKKVHKKYSRQSDTAILKAISAKAVQSLRR